MKRFNPQEGLILQAKTISELTTKLDSYLAEGWIIFGDITKCKAHYEQIVTREKMKTTITKPNIKQPITSEPVKERFRFNTKSYRWTKIDEDANILKVYGRTKLVLSDVEFSSKELTDIEEIIQKGCGGERHTQRKTTHIIGIALAYEMVGYNSKRPADAIQIKFNRNNGKFFAGDKEISGADYLFLDPKSPNNSWVVNPKIVCA